MSAGLLSGRPASMVGLPHLIFLTCLVLLSHSKDMPDDACNTCRNIVKAFKDGLSKTAKDSFGGGNTHWEEKNLGSFAFSETRLVEITEGLCAGQSGKESRSCHQMVEANEETLERWWFDHYAKRRDTDLTQFLCVDKLNACCPRGTFGPNCAACPGGPSKPCGGNGQCGGDGTRSGSGKCLCDVGYKGDVCDACENGYFQNSDKTEGVECKACHASCKSLCSSGGPTGCAECAEGYTMTNGACIDDNECEDAEICETDEFCTNTDGSYLCTRCNAACAACTGPASTECGACAKKHFLDGYACRQCHPSCAGACTDATPRSCDDCFVGWKLADHECVDVDECGIEGGDGVNCAKDEYCVNALGSYRCSTCHPACHGCRGPGSDGCVECKVGYELNAANQCVDVDECSVVHGIKQMDTVHQNKVTDSKGHNPQSTSDNQTPRTEAANDQILQSESMDQNPVTESSNLDAVKSSSSVDPVKIQPGLDADRKPGEQRETKVDGDVSGDQGTANASESAVCAGAHMACINTPGSFRCDCEKGYTLTDHQCIPTPKKRPPADPRSPSGSSKPTKQKKSAAAAKKKPKTPWTKLMDARIVQYLAMLVAFLPAMYVLGRNVYLQAAITAMYSVLLYWFCVRVERLALKHP